MDLAFAILMSKAQRAYAHPDRAYSTGAVEEFFFRTIHKIEMTTSNGHPMTSGDAFGSFTDMRGTAQGRGLNEILAEVYARPTRLEELSYQGNEMS